MAESATKPAAVAKPRRRWFQFSLRTLFLLVAVLGVGLGWVGSQVKIVRERKAMREWIAVHRGQCWGVDGYGVPRGKTHFTRVRNDNGLPVPDPPEVSWFRYWLGDRAIDHIEIEASQEDVDRIWIAFPEARVEHFGQSVGPFPEPYVRKANAN